MDSIEQIYKERKLFMRHLQKFYDDLVKVPRDEPFKVGDDVLVLTDNKDHNCSGCVFYRLGCLFYNDLRRFPCQRKSRLCKFIRASTIIGED